jgi:FHA domain
VLLLIVSLALPTKASLEASERARCQALAQAELQRRINVCAERTHPGRCYHDAPQQAEPGDMGGVDVSPFVLRGTGPVASGLYRLSKGRTVVGRSKVGAPDIEIAELCAAPRHFALDWDDHLACHHLTVWGINGIGVNGTLVLAKAEPRGLSDGDELRVGSTSLLYELLPLIRFVGSA